MKNKIKINKRFITKKIKYNLGIFLIILLLGISFVGAYFLISQGIVNIIFNSNEVIRIQSPQNITYYFDKGSNYTLDLNVSSSRNMSQWFYTLKDLKHNTLIYNDIPFIPNTNFNAVRWNNSLTVYGTDINNYTSNQSVIFFVFVNNSAPVIQNLTDQYICENNHLSYIFSATDIDEDNLNYKLIPQYPLNSFYITKINQNLNITDFEVFSGRLTKDNLPELINGSQFYNETVTVDDNQYSDSKSFKITLIEINNPPKINDIGVHTIWAKGENSTFYYQVNVQDSEDGNQDSGNLNFSIIFPGENLFNISSNGIMNFTAEENESGVYNIEVCAKDRGIANPYPNITTLCNQDGSSITACKNLSLTITKENRKPKIISYFPFPFNMTINASALQDLHFNVSAYDSDGNLLDINWYVDDNLEKYDPITLTSDFTYSFDCSNTGDHKIKVMANDGELNDSVEWNISVKSCPPSIFSSGGGGGGGNILACTPKWACTDWGYCNNLKKSLDSGLINNSLNSIIKERCQLLNFKEDVCGIQLRNCTDINKCKGNITNPGIIRECYFTENPNCHDGIKNCHDGNCEVLTDCGGSCPPCPTCSDGIKNQGETGIDCGGSCPQCNLESPYSKNNLLTIFFIVIFLLIFFIALIFIIRLLIRYYSSEKELNIILKKKDKKIG